MDGERHRVPQTDRKRRYILDLAARHLEFPERGFRFAAKDRRAQNADGSEIAGRLLAAVGRRANVENNVSGRVEDELFQRMPSRFRQPAEHDVFLRLAACRDRLRVKSPNLACFADINEPVRPKLQAIRLIKLRKYRLHTRYGIRSDGDIENAPKARFEAAHVGDQHMARCQFENVAGKFQTLIGACDNRRAKPRRRRDVRLWITAASAAALVIRAKCTS